MESESGRRIEIVPDASLVLRWHARDAEGWDSAEAFRRAFVAGTLDFTAPEHLKVEVIRVLQLGVRDRRYTAVDGIEYVEAFLAMPIEYVPNDMLFRDAFRLATDYQMALYDALYVALAEALAVPFVTADRRLANLGRQRGIATISWYSDFTVPTTQSDS